MDSLLAVVNVLNQNKVLWGVSMLMLNFGARFVISDLGKAHELMLSNEIVKKVIIMSMFFVATRDLVISFLLTVAYVIIIDGMLHEKRKFCILPKSITDKANKSASTDKSVSQNYLTNISLIK